MAMVGQGMQVNWKKAMVPKSPMAQSSRHQALFFDALRQVCRQRQSMAAFLLWQEVAEAYPAPIREYRATAVFLKRMRQEPLRMSRGSR